MGLTVTLVSGPRRSGKSLVVGLMIDEALEGGAHYLRLTAVNGTKRPPLGVRPPAERCGVSSAEWLCYEQDHIFELLPEALAAIHRRDRNGRVIIEADADPALRHAYPYDQQLFVMAAPRSLGEVFRSVDQAARALQDVLDDTAEFAAEVFGLSFEDLDLDDETREERDLLSKSQIRQFLASPLGDQLATHTQLRPEYHGLLESDVVLVNTAAGGGPAVAEGCRRRLEQLLLRVQTPTAVRPNIFCCDPTDPEDPRRREFLDSLRILCLQRR
ncbi:MAG: hypothetical protein V2A79_08315 [Planctomycetota bacterium]